MNVMREKEFANTQWYDDKRESVKDYYGQSTEVRTGAGMLQIQIR